MSTEHKNEHPLERFRYCPVCGSDGFETNSSKSRKCRDCGFEYFMNSATSTVAIIEDGMGNVLVCKRAKEPAKGTLDLPGGFCDCMESAERGIAREVMEETGLKVTEAKYLFSLPNIYRYSRIDIHTLDMFFECKVEDESVLTANDDAAECMWVGPDDIHTEQFGLRSVRWGLIKFLGREECFSPENRENVDKNV